MTRFRAGSASHVGQLRSNNQDSKLIADEVSLFAVADGMGGHQGGEVASAIAVETLEDVVTAPTAASLVEAVKEANRRIFAHANQAPELRGMGTTLVAIALVEQGSEAEELTWVNVGDSRVYVLRDGQLVQLSQDHSLVEDLRRGGQLSAEEAAVHPQRNILTRALGIDAEVEVDWRGVEPFAGDRYLLCSDGLFNEVDADAMVEVLGAIDDPDEAAAELVRRANAGGGRDNITCVVVDVVDDDGRAERAAAGAGAGAGAAGAVPEGRPADEPAATDGGLPVTTEMPAVVVDQADDTTPPAGTPAPPPPAPVPEGPGPGEPDPAGEQPVVAGASALPMEDDPEAAAAGDLPFGRPTDDIYGDMDQVGGRHRAMTALVAVIVLALLAAGAFFGLRYLDSDGWFVRADGQRVVIYQGKPGGGIVFDPTEEEVAPTPVADLTAADRAELARTPELDSLADARSLVNTWASRARQAQDEKDEPTTTTTERTTTERDGTTTTDPAASPVPQSPDATAGTTSATGGGG
ncbi:MAG TPA: Stp1/IreP family PP2C-type Ser/Thr phosphatase [Acidimicrobiales bacterium]|nr:Stp1/IreP family PP2C-type Ser/Thr phosphatase [Acidimicrobiales bacterium]